MNYTLEQRNQISEMAKNKTVASLQWDDIDKYWVMTFTDGSEICFRLMAELVNSPGLNRNPSSDKR